MTVSITWSISAGGSSATDFDSGTSSNGSTTTPVQIFVRHDGVNPITNAGFYFTQKSGVYSGDSSSPEDITELLTWGDSITTDDFGGIQLNMDATGGFTGGTNWGMSETQKTSTDNLKVTVRTDTGDKPSTAILLSKNMSASMVTDGTIPAGVNDASFKIRLKVPTSTDTLGVRQFDQVLRFDFTS